MQIHGTIIFHVEQEVFFFQTHLPNICFIQVMPTLSHQETNDALLGYRQTEPVIIIWLSFGHSYHFCVLEYMLHTFGFVYFSFNFFNQ